MAKQSKIQRKTSSVHRARKAPRCPQCGRRMKQAAKPVCQFRSAFHASEV
jgi:tRNA(Ile2) C34 agmatinyltransferase TiaS